jgi:hypothetical protein
MRAKNQESADADHGHLQAGLAMNKIFEVLGENKKYIEFYHTARAGPRARARTLQPRGSSGRVYKRPSFKNLLCWLFFFWQASSTEQLDQSNLIIFHAYTV